MTADEFEELIHGAQECDSLEFKGAMDWDEGLIKDVLAMANVRDGGRIVIGIEDKRLVRQGLSQEQLDSYSLDTMMDKIGTYADPHVSLFVDKVDDQEGLSFVVISVMPFERTPVICARDGKDLKKGAIYYRSKTNRPSSAQVHNAIDMRDILDRATVHTMRHYRDLGLEVRADDLGNSPNPYTAEARLAHALDRELEGL